MISLQYKLITCQYVSMIRDYWNQIAGRAFVPFARVHMVTTAHPFPTAKMIPV